jgi:hypothetical protein
MKKEEPPAVAGKLTIVRPFRARKTGSDRPVAFDIVALCCSSQVEVSLRGQESQSQEHWLRDQLPGTFPNARILAYGHALQTSFDLDFVDETKRLALEFLSLLLNFRQDTNTVGSISRVYMRSFQVTSSVSYPVDVRLTAIYSTIGR